MDHFLFSVNAILPVFILMGLGRLLRVLKICDVDFLTKANAVSFRVFLPVLLFSSIYDLRDSGAAPDWRYMGLALGGILAIAGALILTVPRVVRAKGKVGVVIQGIFRSNFLLLGIPLVTNMFGEEELWSASLLLPISIPAFNALAVVVLTCFQDRPDCGRRVSQTVLDVLKNPLIIGSALGFLFLSLRIPIPAVLDGCIGQIAAVATPLALISLGGKLEFGRVRENLRYILAVCAGRLIVVPAVMLPIVIAFGYRASALAAMLALFASPTAVSSYVMAEQTGNDGALAGQIVAFTTAASAFTMFVWIFALRSLGYL